ncbi:MAG: helix-turn-helix transcriptional regulator [Eubacteriaceae bacterium]|nr:helix-turn-helix transcriptional regulator [Eubacteriaceae bacterium]
MGERNKLVFSLLKEQRKTKSAMADILGISRSAISQWEKNGTDPTLEQCVTLAQFFNVPLSRIYPDAQNEWQPKLTKKDERDIKNAIEAIKNQLSTGTGLMYDGEPLDEESQEAILAAIEVAERTAILEAKKRYTPKKYRE